MKRLLTAIATVVTFSANAGWIGNHSLNMQFVKSDLIPSSSLHDNSPAQIVLGRLNGEPQFYIVFPHSSVCSDLGTDMETTVLEINELKVTATSGCYSGLYTYDIRDNDEAEHAIESLISAARTGKQSTIDGQKIPIEGLLEQWRTFDGEASTL